MREKLLTAWGEFSFRHSGLIVAVMLLLAVAAIFSASRLTLKMRWSDLMPLSDPMVQEFNKIQTEYTSTTNSIIVVMGQENRMKSFADDIAPKIKSMTKYVKRVDYKIEEDFLRSHGLMLVKSKDLRKMVDNKLFDDFNLIEYLTHTNDNFEDVYIGDDESLSDKEKEDDAVRSLDGIRFWVETMTRYINDENTIPDSLANLAVERMLLGDPYFISPDKRMLLITIEPTFSITDIESSVASTDSIQAIIDNTLKDYPQIKAGLTGTVPLMRDEMVYSEKDMQITSVIAFILVLLLLIFSFRLIAAPLLAGINLVLGIILASGMIAVFIDSLNIMTSMFAVVLIGLGIDFSIHIISLYYERRAVGDNVADAATYTLSRSGSGILTGALTSSIAFFTLMISETRGIKEMGLVLGVGLMTVMISTILTLPSLLIMREKIIAKIAKHRAKEPRPLKNVEFPFLGKTGGIIEHRPKTILAIAIIISIIMLFFALDSKFSYNILDLEPAGIPSVTLQDSMLVAFDMSPDFVMVTAASTDEAGQIAKRAKQTSSVSAVESISNYLPSTKEQDKRIPSVIQLINQLENAHSEIPMKVIDVPRLIEQLDRLDMNIYELGQMAFIGGQDKVENKCSRIAGNPDDDSSESIIQKLIMQINQNGGQALKGLNLFQKKYIPVMQAMAVNMADTSRITLENLPADIRNRFINKDKNEFLITIFPKEQVWDFEFLKRFNGQMQRISEKITGMPPLMLRLFKLVGRDGKNACILALIMVFLLLWLDFRRIKLAMITMIPLIVGAVWMIGLLSMLGLPLTYVNIMAIPMIIGIGIDDGVHLMHRYRIEGWYRTKEVLSSTGKAILLTSLTTIAGFGSLMIAKYRGFASLGSLLVLGVAACFITSILFLPALVNLLKKSK